MKVVIDIPDEEYEDVKKAGGCYYDFGKAIYYGIPLDKIRTEIEQLTIVEGGDDYTRKMAELLSLKMKVLQIINKYTAESEVEE